MLRIGDKLSKEGEYVKAMQTFQRCLSDFADVEDAQCLAATLQSLGLAYCQQGEIAKAIVFYTRRLSPFN
jgi:tetratricopeptide (TPR) repeat protein